MYADANDGSCEGANRIFSHPEFYFGTHTR